MAIYNSTHTGIEIDNAIDTIDALTESIEIAIAAAGYQIIGDFADVTKAEVTLENQVYTSKSIVGFESYVWRTTEVLPYTPTGSDPTTGAELGKWVAVAIGELVTIARSLNVADSAVIYATDTVTVLDNVQYIYDASAQTIWSVPTLDGSGETIVSVTGDQLTTSANTYTLLYRKIKAGKVQVWDEDVPAGDNRIFVRDVISSTSDRSTTVQIQRQVNSATGTNPKALRALTVLAAGVDSVEYAVSAEFTNNSDINNGGSSASSAVSIKNGKANTFAGHFQVKDTQGDISSIGGAIIGQELNIQANGVDDSEIRIGYDIIARTYQPNFATDGSGEFHAGVRIRNSSLGAEGGKWVNALIIEDGIQAIPKAITIANSPGTGVGYSIEDTGDKARGIDLQGQYGVAAIDMRNSNLTVSDTLIRLKDRGKIEFETGVSLKWDTAFVTPSLGLLGQPTQTSGTGGAATALPSNPVGYLKIQLNGSPVVIPYYTGV